MNINKIILKLIHDKASSEELEILEEWKSDSEENVRVLNDMIKLNQASSGLDTYHIYDVDNALTNVEEKIFSQNEVEKSTQGSNTKSYLIWGSILILLLASVLLYFNKDKIWEVEPTYFNTEFAALDIELKDGSLIKLDKMSTIDISDDFLHNRIVNLNGRAFFNVTHMDKNAPFIVKIPNCTIKVIGTEFSVFSDGIDAEISVLSGIVEVTSENRKVQLTRGEHLLYEDNTFFVKESTNNNYYGWSTGILSYNDAPIREVFEDLSWTYTIKFDTSSIKLSNNCRISTRYKDMELQEILQELKSLFGLDYIYKDDVIFVRSINCS